MKIRIYTLMTALFILGIICGVLLSLGFAKKQINSISGRSTPEVTELIVKFLDRRLRLSPEQELAIGNVLRESEKDVLPLRRELRTRGYGIIQTVKPKMDQHLDDSQRKILDDLLNDLLTTWQISVDPDAPAKP